MPFVSVAVSLSLNFVVSPPKRVFAAESAFLFSENLVYSTLDTSGALLSIPMKNVVLSFGGSESTAPYSFFPSVRIIDLSRSTDVVEV